MVYGESIPTDKTTFPMVNTKKLNLFPSSLRNDAYYLENNDVKIINYDFRDAVSTAQKNDFVYFDPPYIPLTPTSSFTNYTKNGFGMVQQKELRDLAISLTHKNVKVMISNSSSEITKELYKSKTFKIRTVRAGRAINSNGKKRGKVDEFIITNY